MPRRADSRRALVLAMVVLLAGGALPALAQEGAKPKPPTTMSAPQQATPRVRVRLVSPDQLNAPVSPAGSAAEVPAMSGPQPAPVTIAVPPPMSDPSLAQPAAEPAGESQPPDHAASLFDALISNSWAGGGFDGPAAGPAPREITVDAAPALVEAPSSATTPGAGVPPRIPGSLSPAAAADAGAYTLGPGDVVEVFVWRNPELSREVPVRPDGRISLPLVGEVIASGKSPEQLQQEIAATLAQYVQMPTVTVSIKQIRSLVVYVLGNVTKPGPVQMDRSLTVLQAIAMAGGLNDFADRKDIVVLRTDEFGVHQRWTFRYDDVVAGRDLQTNLSLRAGDVIYVP